MEPKGAAIRAYLNTFTLAGSSDAVKSHAHFRLKVQVTKLTS